MTQQQQDPYRLPLNDEIIAAVLHNPHATFEDMDALYFSLCNHPNYGGTSKEAQAALDAMGKLAYAKKDGYK